jgi:HlyD family secretion protein
MAADLDVSKLALERAVQMREQKLISEQAYDETAAAVRMKEAALESQRRRISQQAAILESDRDDLSKTTVVSPMDGVVTSLAKEEGEVVIGAQSFQPTVVMTVADLSVMEVEVLVDETDIRNITLGQQAEVRVDALDNLKIKGQVTEIGSSAIPRGSGSATISATTTANQAKDFKVVVRLDQPPATLRPGLNATADITTSRKTGVLAIPIQAVVVREVNEKGKVVDPGSLQAAENEPSPGPVAKDKKAEEKEGVFLVKNGQAEFHPVKTGIMGESEIEVMDGLGEGAEIVTGSYRTLRTLKDQAHVKIEQKKERG